jgi:NAD+ kinase
VTVEGELAPADGDDRSLTDEAGNRWWVVLNEVVAEKAVPGHMVHLSTTIDGEPFLAYKADGVLVATPTGSTAYNLSAGGPVVATRLAAMVLTPVAAHLSFDRSLVLDAEQVVTVEVRGGRPAVLVVDGREVGRLSPGAEVTCRVAPEPLRMVSLRARGFADLLRRTVAPDRGGWA